MADKIKRADLFNENADLNSRGYRKNLLTDGEPDEALMQEWAESIVWFDEPEDRAKQSTGSEEDKDLVGHVQIATDVEAKGNINGLEEETTKVPHSGQLPTVQADPENQIIDGNFTPDFDDTPVEVEVDPNVDTRNNFLVRFKQSFLDFIGTVTNQISTNISNITTNSSNITDLQNDVTNILNNGAPSTLQTQGNDSNVGGADTQVLNFEGDAVTSVTDEGSGKRTILIEQNPNAGTPVVSWVSLENDDVLALLSATRRATSPFGTVGNITLSRNTEVNSGNCNLEYAIIDKVMLLQVRLNITLTGDVLIDPSFPTGIEPYFVDLDLSSIVTLDGYNADVDFRVIEASTGINGNGNLTVQSTSGEKVLVQDSGSKIRFEFALGEENSDPAPFQKVFQRGFQSIGTAILKIA